MPIYFKFWSKTISTLIDEIDYDSLGQLIGKGVGNKGLDTAPDAEFIT